MSSPKPQGLESTVVYGTSRNRHPSPVYSLPTCTQPAISRCHHHPRPGLRDCSSMTTKRRVCAEDLAPPSDGEVIFRAKTRNIDDMINAVVEHDDPVQQQPPKKAKAESKKSKKGTAVVNANAETKRRRILKTFHVMLNDKCNDVNLIVRFRLNATELRALASAADTTNANINLAIIGIGINPTEHQRCREEIGVDVRMGKLPTDASMPLSHVWKITRKDVRDERKMLLCDMFDVVGAVDDLKKYVEFREVKTVKAVVKELDGDDNDGTDGTDAAAEVPQQEAKRKPVPVMTSGRRIDDVRQSWGGHHDQAVC